MSKPRFIFFFTSLLGLALVLGACSPAATATQVSPVQASLPPAAEETAAPPSSALELTDGMGRTVSLPAIAQRIVSLAPSNTEILYAIGAGSQIVGRDDFSDYPEEAKNLPSIGGSMGDYDLEKLASLKPDLILASGLNTPEQIKSMADLGLTVFFVANPVDLDGMYANLKTVGELSGREQAAVDLAAALEQRVKAVMDKVTNVSEKPVVFYELDGTDPSKPYTSGPGTYLDQMIVMAGGQNVGAKLQSEWGQLSLEELLVSDPDFIILGDAAYGATPEVVSQRAGWEKLKAVQNQQIFPFDDNTVSRPGPRMVDGLEGLAKLIHPEEFE